MLTLRMLAAAERVRPARGAMNFLEIAIIIGIVITLAVIVLELAGGFFSDLFDTVSDEFSGGADRPDDF